MSRSFRMIDGVDWQATERPDLQGNFLISPEAATRGIDQEVAVLLGVCAVQRGDALRGPNQETLPSLGGVSQGVVYEIGDFAVKMFNNQIKNPHSTQRRDNLPNLQANVQLEHAVERADENGVDISFPDSNFTYTTPRHLGAFVPHLNSDRDVRPYWVMSLEKGVAPISDLPNTIQNRYMNNREASSAFLKQSLTLDGVDPRTVDVEEVVNTESPIIRYRQPESGTKRQRKAFLESVDCTVVLHDTRRI